MNRNEKNRRWFENSRRASKKDLRITSPEVIAALLDKLLPSTEVAK